MVTLWHFLANCWFIHFLEHCLFFSWKLHTFQTRWLVILRTYREILSSYRHSFPFNRNIFLSFLSKIYSKNWCYNSEKVTHRGEKCQEPFRNTFVTTRSIPSKWTTARIQKLSFWCKFRVEWILCMLSMSVHPIESWRKWKKLSSGSRGRTSAPFKCYDFWVSFPWISNERQCEECYANFLKKSATCLRIVSGSCSEKHTQSSRTTEAPSSAT